MNNAWLDAAPHAASPRTDTDDHHALFEQAASIIPMGAFACKLANGRLSWTRGVFELFGLPNDTAPERERIVAMYTEASRELLERRRSHAIATRSRFSLDANIMRPDGTERWIRITAAVRSVNGRSDTLYGMKQDITEDRARWEQLRRQAEYDPLTGVANRLRFQRFIDEPDEESTLGQIGTLVLFDLDGFKLINDRWGHAAGDACLVAFGARLRRAFAHARLISRIGGDEFAVLLPPLGTPSKLERELYWQTQTLLGPVPWNGVLLPIGASIGIAHASQDPASSPQNLFVDADRKLYEAKRAPAHRLFM